LARNATSHSAPRTLHTTRLSPADQDDVALEATTITSRSSGELTNASKPTPHVLSDQTQPDRHLEKRARELGFCGLWGYLQARCDAGHSIPRIAAELGVHDWQVTAALLRLGVRLAPRPQRLAAQRRQHTEERIAARVAELGFADVGAYLLDRVVERAWLLAEVAAELAAHRLTVRRLLDRHGIRRVRRTAAERAAADAGLRVQAVSWQARRTGRLAELGFADLAGYLKARRVEQGWPVRRMRAELRVGRRWLVGELDRLGLRP
jgi:hypothetical protein